MVNTATQRREQMNNCPTFTFLITPELPTLLTEANVTSTQRNKIINGVCDTQLETGWLVGWLVGV